MKVYTVYPGTARELTLGQGDWVSWSVSGGVKGGAKSRRLTGKVLHILPPTVDPDDLLLVKRPYRRYRGNTDGVTRLMVAVPRKGVKGQPIRSYVYLVYPTEKSDITLVRRSR